MIEIAVKFFNTQEKETQQIMLESFASFREKNFLFSKEYFFDKGLDEKVLNVYFIPGSPSYNKLRDYVTLTIKMDEKVVREFLEKIISNNYENTFGRVDAKIMDPSDSKFYDSSFDTRDVYMVEFS